MSEMLDLLGVENVFIVALNQYMDVDSIAADDLHELKIASTHALVWNHLVQNKKADCYMVIHDTMTIDSFIASTVLLQPDQIASNEVTVFWQPDDVRNPIGMYPYAINKKGAQKAVSEAPHPMALYQMPCFERVLVRPSGAQASS